MIIKTYRAKTSSEVLKRVKEEMGGNAIVLKSSQVVNEANQSIFEVTACLENPTVAQSSMLLDSKQTSNQTITQMTASNSRVNEKNISVSPVENRFADTAQADNEYPLKLSNGDFDSDSLDKYKNIISADPDASSLRKSLIKDYSNIVAEPIEFKAGDKIAFLGLAGCGKSSVLGKLASDLIFKAKQKVKLVTVDDFKLGAYDEIAAYADILGLAIGKIGEAGNNDEITLIDTNATPIDEAQLESLKKKIDTIKPNYRIAVFSALIRTNDVRRHAKIIKQLNPTHLVITKIDLTQSMGSILAAAEYTGAKVLYLSNAPGGMGSLSPLDPASIVDKILNYEVAGE